MSRILGWVREKVAGARTLVWASILTASVAVIALAGPQSGPGAPPAKTTGTPPTQTSGTPAPATGADQKPAATGTAATEKGTPPVEKDGTPATDKPETWVDIGIKIANTYKDFIVGIIASLGAVGWAFAALLLLFALRKPLEQLLKAVTEAMRDRSVTFDIASVKVQVDEPSPRELDEEAGGVFSAPFEIAEEPVRDGILREIAGQLVFQVSDYVARAWEKAHGMANTECMRRHRQVLAAKCAEDGADIHSVLPALLEFVRSLAKSRFREAEQFGKLIDDSSFLWDDILSLATENLVDHAANFQIVHATGVAYSQLGNWERAVSALNRIAWKGETPVYAPACAVWLASSYHQYVITLKETTPESQFDSSTFRTYVSALFDRAQRLGDAEHGHSRDVDRMWGYYRRELLKDLGNLEAIVANYSTDAAIRREFYDRARRHLEACARRIEDEDASPLDHNNLADLYREIGDFVASQDPRSDEAAEYYKRAQEELDRALVGNPPYDPAFYHTWAMILFSQRKLDRALDVLTTYREADAEQGGRQDVEQYVDNQVLAAKLAVARYPSHDPRGVALATRILESAATFLAGKRTLLGDGPADERQGNIDELLGFLHLQSPGGQARAVAAFDRCLGLSRWNPSEEVELRCRLGRARALTQFSRVERHQFAGPAAAALRSRAGQDLAWTRRTVKAFPIDETVSAERRERNVRLWLELAVAIQALAEEHFIGDEAAMAEDLSKEETAVLISIQGVLDAPGDRDPGMRTQARRTAARRSFLSGRLLVRADPSLETPNLVTKVREAFLEARGTTAELDCRIDLELGSLLLTAARLAKVDDPPAFYREAVAALERAAQRDVPTLRADTIRALASAYAQRAAIMRQAKASAKK